MEKPEEVRLIDLDETHSGEHTVFIMPPEEPQEPDGSECPALYRYRVTASEGLKLPHNTFLYGLIFPLVCPVMKPSPH